MFMAHEHQNVNWRREEGIRVPLLKPVKRFYLEILFRPTCVLVQDFTGVSVSIYLAPVIDHSVMIDNYLLRVGVSRTIIRHQVLLAKGARTAPRLPKWLQNRAPRVASSPRNPESVI